MSPFSRSKYTEFSLKKKKERGMLIHMMSVFKNVSVERI